MGTDLTLVVNKFGYNDNMPLAYERIRIDRDYDLFDSIKQAGALPLRENRDLLWYGDDGIEQRTEDPWGAPLTSIRAGILADVMSRHDLSPKNSAVTVYMRALPSDTEIFLWWH